MKMISFQCQQRTCGCAKTPERAVSMRARSGVFVSLSKNLASGGVLLV